MVLYGGILYILRELIGIVLWKLGKRIYIVCFEFFKKKKLV